MLRLRTAGLCCHRASLVQESMVAVPRRGCNELRRAGVRRRQPMHAKRGTEQGRPAVWRLGRSGRGLRDWGCTRPAVAKKACAPKRGTQAGKACWRRRGEGKPSRRSDRRRPAGALRTSPGSAGPLAVRGAGTLPPKGIPGRYALRGRPARWAKPMRAWVSLAAVKSAWCRPGRGASSTTSMPTMLRPCRQRSMSSRA